MNEKIGKFIKRERNACRMSQAMLGRAVGVTFQQMQKYENGSNRVSLPRFIEICRVLSIDPCVGLAHILDDIKTDVKPRYRVTTYNYNLNRLEQRVTTDKDFGDNVLKVEEI